MKTTIALMLILTATPAIAGDYAGQMGAIDAYCEQQGQGGWLSGTVCQQKVLNALSNGGCQMYKVGQVIGTYVVTCK